MSEMVERVAKAQLAAMDKWALANGKEWYETPALVVARAAIEAMRNPTQDMCAHGSGGEIGELQAGTTWRWMIDAALAP